MAALLHSGESGRSSLIASAEAVDTGVAPRLQEAVRMRGSRVLLVGISALMATPIAIGVATSALGAQLAPRTSLLVTQAMAPAPATTAVVEPPAVVGDEVSVTIPPIIFGTSDGLPAKITVGASYKLAIRVWASADTKNPTVKITYGTTVYSQPLSPGQVMTIQVPVLGQGADVKVIVSSNPAGHAGAKTFAHTLA